MSNLLSMKRFVSSKTYLLLCFLGVLILTGFYSTRSGFFFYNNLEVSLWAKQPMLKNPVAISHDHQGRLYVTEANRRKSTDLDVRNMKGLEPIPWPALDYSLTSVEERRTLLKTYFDPMNGMEHPWLKDFDGDGTKHWIDLQQKTERVHRIVDTNGDGVADESSVFAEGFNTEVTGTAGGVLWFDDKVYFTVIPDLWLLQDADHDGKADQRESLITGHGVHIGQGGHDLHGLTLGPDGRIYWSIGDKGINITSQEGQHFYYPNQGVVMRSEPDGSRFEVFAHGLRNCQELSFDNYGNLFCVDNDGDFKGERERLVYVTQGSDTGWRINWQHNHTESWAESQRLPHYNPWMNEGLSIPHFDEQAAYITPTLKNYSDGPAGFIRNPGTALSEAYEDHYFLTQFPGQLITSFQLRPSGASFEMFNESTFFEGFMATGLSFSPDGSLFVADWAGNWEPTEDGAIFKIDVKDADRHSLRDSTEILIRGDIEAHSTSMLLALLAYPDQRVRLNAQFELVERNAYRELLRVATDHQNEQLARIHSIWGLGQIARTGTFREPISLRVLLNDSDPQIRIQACKMIAEAPFLFDWYENELILLLKDPEPHVRFHAAMGLSFIGTDNSIPALFELLESNNNSDPFIRHAAISALTGINEQAELLRARSHSSRAVRRGVVVALRRLKDPSISAYLQDEDPLVILEAARAIHDDFGIPEALPDLAAILPEHQHTDHEALTRRILNANLRTGGMDELRAVLHVALSPESPASLRAEALDIAITWHRPPVLDRVERRYRQLPERNRADIVAVVEEMLPDLLAIESSSIKKRVFTLIKEYDIPWNPKSLQKLLADESRPALERSEALELLTSQSKERRKAFKTAFNSESDSLRTNALAVLAKHDEKEVVKRIQEVLKSSGSTSERQAAYTLLGTLNTELAEHTLAPWVDLLLAGEVPPVEQLDVFLAASNYDRFTNQLSSKRAFSYTLQGGNAARGEDIYLNHPTAQCIRCHSMQEQGSQVGPNLQGIGDTASRAYLLEALIEPNASFAPGFQSDVSAMPSMEYLLTPGELRDLIEYLSQL